MILNISPTPYPDVNLVLARLLIDARAVLEGQFVGLYLYGSLSSGDFHAERSDIDFVVAVSGRLPDECIRKLEEMHRLLWQSGLKWANRLEGSYVPLEFLRRHTLNCPPCPTVNEGKFFLGEMGSDWIFQRFILREMGVVVAGPQPKSLIDPVSKTDLRRGVVGFVREWWAPMLEKPERLASREYQAYAILSMCRAMYTLETGKIASKAKSAEWMKTRTGEMEKRLIEEALNWPEGPQPDRLAETVGFIRRVVEKTAAHS